MRDVAGRPGLEHVGLAGARTLVEVTAAGPQLSTCSGSPDCVQPCRRRRQGSRALVTVAYTVTR